MSKLSYAGQFDFGDVDIIQPNGLAISVVDQIQQVTIYEDLFSPFMSGNIIFKDTISIPTLLMNGGADLVRIRLGTPTLTKDQYIHRYFHIYKMSDRIVVNERTSEFVIHFISQESLTDTSVLISKTFKGRAEDNIDHILKKIIRTKVPFNADTTINDITYTSNYWPAVKNIAYNCDFAQHTNGYPAMTFYENRNGFNFKSIVELGKAEPYMKFESSNHLSKVGEGALDRGTVTKDFQQDFQTILSMTTPVIYDYMKDKSNGMMSNRLVSFDFTTKKMTDVTYSLQSDTRKLMNENRFYKDEIIETSYQGTHSSNLLPVAYRHNNLYTGKNDVSDVKIKQKRISVMRHMQQHRIEITVFGRTDYTVGQTIHVSANKLLMFTKEMSADQITDPLISGKYLVSAVCHIFTKEGKHQTTLELIRDSVGKAK